MAFGNGFPHHPHHQLHHGTGPAAFGLGPSGRTSSSNGTANAALNPRDLAAAQLVAQQQAVYEAAMVS